MSNTTCLFRTFFPPYICRTVSIRAIKPAASVAPCKSGNASSVLTLTREGGRCGHRDIREEGLHHVRWHRQCLRKGGIPLTIRGVGKNGKAVLLCQLFQYRVKLVTVRAMPLHKQHHLPVGQVNLPAVAEAEPAGEPAFLSWLMCLLPVVQAARPCPADSRVVQFHPGWRPARHVAIINKMTGSNLSERHVRPPAALPSWPVARLPVPHALPG